MFGIFCLVRVLCFWVWGRVVVTVLGFGYLGDLGFRVQDLSLERYRAPTDLGLAGLRVDVIWVLAGIQDFGAISVLGFGARLLGGQESSGVGPVFLP